MTLREKQPFAVVGSKYVLELDEMPVCARAYPWGVVEIENPMHSDLAALRELLGQAFVLLFILYKLYNKSL